MASGQTNVLLDDFYEHFMFLVQVYDRVYMCVPWHAFIHSSAGHLCHHTNCSIVHTQHKLPHTMAALAHLSSRDHTPGQSSPNSMRSYSIIAITIGYNLGANGIGIDIVSGLQLQRVEIQRQWQLATLMIAMALYYDASGFGIQPCTLLLESIINDIFASIMKAVCAISLYVMAERRQMWKVPP